MQEVLLMLQMLHQMRHDAFLKNVLCMYSKPKKKRNTPIYFNTNYRREMKLVAIIMDYCLL